MSVSFSCWDKAIGLSFSGNTLVEVSVQAPKKGALSPKPGNANRTKACFKQARGDSMQTLTHRLLLGCSTAALVAVAAPAIAQDEPATEQVIVTGTSIRGAAPVGADLITVDAAAIKATGAQTVADIMVNVPGITSMG